MTCSHGRDARSIAANNTGPMGVLCHCLTAQLDAKDRLIGWLLALVVEQTRRRTTGGVPRAFTASWRNTALPVQVHDDYAGRL